MASTPQELETLVAYLGLDWNNEEVESFLQSRGSCGLLQFMSTFVRNIEVVRAAPGSVVANWLDRRVLCRAP